MKNKVKFSIYSKIITVLVLILFAAGVIALLDNTRELPLFCIIMGGATITGLYFCPISIEADQSGCYHIRNVLRTTIFSQLTRAIHPPVD